MASNAEVGRAYRDLLRTALHAVRYAKPARFVVRDRLRDTFRGSEPTSFDAAKTDRMLMFLRHARDARGLEHKVLKNYLHVCFVRSRIRAQNLGVGFYPWFKHAYKDWDKTVRRLNETMGLDLR